MLNQTLDETTLVVRPLGDVDGDHRTVICEQSIDKTWHLEVAEDQRKMCSREGQPTLRILNPHCTVRKREGFFHHTAIHSTCNQKAVYGGK